MLKSANPQLCHGAASPGVLGNIRLEPEAPLRVEHAPAAVSAGSDSNTAPAVAAGSTNEKYIKLGKIGEGTYGIVYKAVTAIKRDIVALKKVYDPKKANVTEQEGIPAASLREIIALKMLRHRNIVGLLDIVTQDRCIYVVLEYMSTDLAQELDKMKKQSLPGLPERDVIIYAYQILSALAYCHERRMMHRDLKPQNILVEPQTKSVKIADFGLARSFKNTIEVPVTCEVVTLWYRAPEILLGCKMYTIAIDVWSTGFIIAEMISGVPLAPGDSEINQIYKIFQIFGTPTTETWPGIMYHPNFELEWPVWRPKPLRELLPRAVAVQIDLIKCLCRYKPGERLTAKRALQLPMFDFIRNAAIEKSRTTAGTSCGAASAISSRRRSAMTCVNSGSRSGAGDSGPAQPSIIAAAAPLTVNVKCNNSPTVFADASVYYSTPEYSFSSDNGICCNSQGSSGERSGSSATQVADRSDLLASANDSGFGSADSNISKLPNSSNKRRVCFSVGDAEYDGTTRDNDANDSMTEQPFVGTDSSFYAGKRQCAKKVAAGKGVLPTCAAPSCLNNNFERSFSSRPATRSAADGAARGACNTGFSTATRARAPASFCLSDNVAPAVSHQPHYYESDNRFDGDMSLDTSIGDELIFQQQQQQKTYEIHNKHHQNSTFLGGEGARDAIRDRTHGLLQRSMSNAACWPKDMLSSSFRS